MQFVCPIPSKLQESLNFSTTIQCQCLSVITKNLLLTNKEYVDSLGNLFISILSSSGDTMTVMKTDAVFFFNSLSTH